VRPIAEATDTAAYSRLQFMFTRLDADLSGQLEEPELVQVLRG
jgi:hypothetical protein